MDKERDQELATQAEAEIEAWKARSVEDGYSEASRRELWTRIGEWLEHPGFRGNGGMLRCTVLNQIHFCLGHRGLWEETWKLLESLAARWHREGNEDLKIALVIASFECIAEPPPDPDNLRRLFALAGDPATRWAVFGAYEGVPWRLRPHALCYSDGLVTDEDCENWLAEEHWDDEVLMSKSRRAPWERDG